LNAESLLADHNPNFPLSPCDVFNSLGGIQGNKLVLHTGLDPRLDPSLSLVIFGFANKGYARARAHFFILGEGREGGRGNKKNDGKGDKTPAKKDHRGIKRIAKKPVKKPFPDADDEDNGEEFFTHETIPSPSTGTKTNKRRKVISPTMSPDLLYGSPPSFSSTMTSFQLDASKRQRQPRKRDTARPDRENQRSQPPTDNRERADRDRARPEKENQTSQPQTDNRERPERENQRAQPLTDRAEWMVSFMQQQLTDKAGEISRLTAEVDSLKQQVGKLEREKIEAQQKLWIAEQQIINLHQMKGGDVGRLQKDSQDLRADITAMKQHKESLKTDFSQGDLLFHL
jgi:hypothetical protein